MVPLYAFRVRPHAATASGLQTLHDAQRYASLGATLFGPPERRRASLPPFATGPKKQARSLRAGKLFASGSGIRRVGSSKAPKCGHVPSPSRVVRFPIARRPLFACP